MSMLTCGSAIVRIRYEPTNLNVTGGLNVNATCAGVSCRSAPTHSGASVASIYTRVEVRNMKNIINKFREKMLIPCVQAAFAAHLLINGSSK